MATQACQPKIIITFRGNVVRPKQQCLHPQAINDECRDCGFGVGKDYGVPFMYMEPGLRLSHKAASDLKQLCTNNLLRRKKLILVLDIDHTLLHAIRIGKAKPRDMDYLKKRDDLFMLEEIGYMVKFRPFVRAFLKEANSLFEMYLYTRADRKYAKNMATLLDPDHIYFGNRIISRDETPNSFKTLDLVAGQERAIVVVDDTITMWPNDQKNVLAIEKYCYFAQKKYPTIDGYLKMRTDESKTEGGLMRMLTSLKDLHARFFTRGSCRDIRRTLAARRRLTLQGCIIHVAVKDVGDEVQLERLYEMATKQGAKCCKVFNSLATHVVTMDKIKVPAFFLKKMFFVNPAWIEASYIHGERQPEENFLIL